MSAQQLTTEAMALSLPERVSLAQALWESIDAALADVPEDVALREATRRDQELSSGAIAGQAHEKVMQGRSALDRMRLIYHLDAGIPDYWRERLA